MKLNYKKYGSKSSNTKMLCAGPSWALKVNGLMTCNKGIRVNFFLEVNIHKFSYIEDL